VRGSYVSSARSIASLDLKEVVNDAVISTQQLTVEKNIAIDLDLAENAPAVSGDRDRLVQVMVNLISNAVKFCDPDRGMIVVRLRVVDQHLRVEVQDNGVGIKPEDQTKVFEPSALASNPKIKPKFSNHFVRLKIRPRDARPVPASV
jgi:signal transduction histidine kinase